MATKQDIVEKLLKLKSMAEDEGSPNEAASAKKFLDKLLKKYNISLDDLVGSNTPEPFVFNYHTKHEKKLIAQIFWAVTGHDSIYKIRGKNSLMLYLNQHEYVDFCERKDFYIKQWKKDVQDTLDNFYKAFVTKHNIFHEDAQTKNNTDPEEAKKVIKMMGQVSNNFYEERVDPKKRINK